MTTAPEPAAVVGCTVNGVRHSLPAGSTVADLIRHLELQDRRVAVERNAGIIPRSRHGSELLADGDRIEIVVAVGGG